MWKGELEFQSPHLNGLKEKNMMDVTKVTGVMVDIGNWPLMAPTCFMPMFTDITSCIPSRRALGSTQPPIHWVSGGGGSFPGDKVAGA
jgi:hypothetical protein